MKKISGLLVVCLFTFMLTACGGEKETEKLVCTLEDDTQTYVRELYYQGEEITSAYEDLTMYFDTELEATQTKNMIEPTAGQLTREYGEGVQAEVTVDGTDVKLVIDLDFNKLEKEDAKTLNYDLDLLTPETFEEILVAAGYECK